MLNPHLASFNYEPNDDDPSSDPVWTHIHDADLYIQDCRSYGAGYSLNRLTRDAQGQVNGSRHILRYRTLVRAMHDADLIAGGRNIDDFC